MGDPYADGNYRLKIINRAGPHIYAAPPCNCCFAVPIPSYQLPVSGAMSLCGMQSGQWSIDSDCSAARISFTVIWNLFLLMSAWFISKV